jgi:hypothetical protein
LADIKLLHWNIQQFSNNKLNNANRDALINYIAHVVRRTEANIISLLELKNSAVNNILARLVPAINVVKGAAPPNQWRAIGINSQKNNEAYIVLYQLGNDFQPLTPAAGGALPINGLTNQTLLASGAPGGTLRFNSSLTKTGGRKPFYAAFQTTDTNNNFTIVAYHTMFGFWSGIGVRSIGDLAQSRAILDAGATVNMDASLTCGDFNVDFNPAHPGDYNKLMNDVPSSYQTNQLTSLKTFTPPGGYPNPVDYRANAYDNIFFYERMAAPAVNQGRVMDLINDSTTVGGGGAGTMSAYAGAFVRGPIQAGHLIDNIPPQGFEDAWHIVRHAISDHLPVYVRADI